MVEPDFDREMSPDAAVWEGVDELTLRYKFLEMSKAVNIRRPSGNSGAKTSWEKEMERREATNTRDQTSD